MLLTVLSAIALTVGGAMTANALNAEEIAAAESVQPVVEVAPIQQHSIEPGELGW